VRLGGKSGGKIVSVHWGAGAPAGYCDAPPPGSGGYSLPTVPRGLKHRDDMNRAAAVARKVGWRVQPSTAAVDEGHFFTAEAGGHPASETLIAAERPASVGVPTVYDRPAAVLLHRWWTVTQVASGILRRASGSSRG
jgi:hypothetical protein